MVQLRMPTAGKYLEHLFAACVAAVMLPGLIVIASLGLDRVNSAAGYGVYQLPGIVIPMYSMAIVLAPILGFAVLVTIWIRRATLVRVATVADAAVRDRAIVAALMAVLLDALWLVFWPYVFFAAGGNR
jgi:hypothetical protein